MSAAPPFLWVGNHPATDLCNTQPVMAGQPVELLGDLVAVLDWSHHAGVGSAWPAETFTPTQRRTTVSFVRRLRDELRPLLESGRRDADALQRLNELLAEQPGAMSVAPAVAPEPAGAAAGATAPPEPAGAAARPSRPDPLRLTGSMPDAQLRLDVVWAVLDIFRHDARLIRRCANPACVLLFLDVSKSGRRRWCDMATCGNRAKAAAHYARTRTS